MEYHYIVTCDPDKSNPPQHRIEVEQDAPSIHVLTARVRRLYPEAWNFRIIKKIPIVKRALIRLEQRAE